MSFNKIINKDFGSVARNKLNTMLEELYQLVGVMAEGLWEEVSGDATRIQPKDTKGIYTPHLRVGGTFPNQISVDSSGVLRLPGLLSLASRKPLMADTEGFVVARTVGMSFITTGSASTPSLGIDAVVVNTSGAYVLTLQSPFGYLGEIKTLRNSSGNSLIIDPTSSYDLYFNDGVPSKLESTTKGDWIMLMAEGVAGDWARWHVIAHGGTWTEPV